MINYLKQYADKTYEELVNSLIWFDLSLKLKAIFAKIPTTFKTINDESIIGEGNIEITGGGGTPQDLQSVLDTGGFAEKDGGNSFVELLAGDVNERFWTIYNRPDDNNGTIVQGNNTNVEIVNTAGTNAGSLQINAGITYLRQNSASGLTDLNFATPLIGTSIKVPAKTIAGEYTINTTPNTIYTVATLPSAILNDMAIVSDATAPTYLGALVGGGAAVTPVWYNGTSWRSR